MRTGTRATARGSRAARRAAAAALHLGSLGVGGLDHPSHQGEEVGEIDFAKAVLLVFNFITVGIDFFDYVLELGLIGIMAKLSHDVT